MQNSTMKVKQGTKNQTQGGYAQEQFKKFMPGYHSGDPQKKAEAAEKAIELLKDFIWSILNQKYGSYKKEHEDMFQECVIGVLSNLGKYDPEKSMPTTFFYVIVVNKIVAYINSNIRKTTQHYAYNIREVEKAKRKLESKGAKITEKDIAIEAGLSLETVSRSIKESNNASSVDLDKVDYLDELNRNLPTPEEEFLKTEKAEALYNGIKNLESEEREVIVLRFGIDGEPMSYKDISNNLGIPVEKVRRFQYSGIRKLRKEKDLRNLFHDNFIKAENILNSTDIAIVPEAAADIMMQDLEGLEDLEIFFQ